MNSTSDGPWTGHDGIRTVGDPEGSEVAVVCCLHGDEPTGKLAVERVLESYGEIPGVAFVLANPRAYERGLRWIDEDLNRAFPGDPGSPSHERRLAARLLEELRDTLVLDVHSTVSEPTPFALIRSRTDRVHEAARNTGVGRVVDVGPIEGGLIGAVDGVAVEVDGTDRRRGIEMASRVIAGFLANYGLIEGERTRSDPAVYRIVDEIPKPREEVRVVVGNFDRVAEGETFARGRTEDLRATEPFYPVLLSEDGYERILGFRAERDGTLSGAQIGRSPGDR